MPKRFEASEDDVPRKKLRSNQSLKDEDLLLQEKLASFLTPRRRNTDKARSSSVKTICPNLATVAVTLPSLWLLCGEPPKRARVVGAHDAEAHNIIVCCTCDWCLKLNSAEESAASSRRPRLQDTGAEHSLFCGRLFTLPQWHEHCTETRIIGVDSVKQPDDFRRILFNIVRVEQQPVGERRSSSQDRGLEVKKQTLWSYLIGLNQAEERVVAAAAAAAGTHDPCTSLAHYVGHLDGNDGLQLVKENHAAMGSVAHCNTGADGALANSRHRRSSLEGLRVHVFYHEEMPTGRWYSGTVLKATTESPTLQVEWDPWIHEPTNTQQAVTYGGVMLGITLLHFGPCPPGLNRGGSAAEDSVCALPSLSLAAQRRLRGVGISGEVPPAGESGRKTSPTTTLDGKELAVELTAANGPSAQSNGAGTTTTRQICERKTSSPSVDKRRKLGVALGGNEHGEQIAMNKTAKDTSGEVLRGEGTQKDPVSMARVSPGPRAPQRKKLLRKSVRSAEQQGIFLGSKLTLPPEQVQSPKLANAVRIKQERLEELILTGELQPEPQQASAEGTDRCEHGSAADQSVILHEEEVPMCNDSVDPTARKHQPAETARNMHDAVRVLPSSGPEARKACSQPLDSMPPEERHQQRCFQQKQQAHQYLNQPLFESEESICTIDLALTLAGERGLCPLSPVADTGNEACTSNPRRDVRKEDVRQAGNAGMPHGLASVGMPVTSDAGCTHSDAVASDPVPASECLARRDAAGAAQDGSDPSNEPRDANNISLALHGVLFDSRAVSDTERGEKVAAAEPLAVAVFPAVNGQGPDQVGRQLYLSDDSTRAPGLGVGTFAASHVSHLSAATAEPPLLDFVLPLESEPQGRMQPPQLEEMQQRDQCGKALSCDAVHVTGGVSPVAVNTMAARDGSRSCAAQQPLRESQKLNSLLDESPQLELIFNQGNSASASPASAGVLADRGGLQEWGSARDAVQSSSDGIFPEHAKDEGALNAAALVSVGVVGAACEVPTASASSADCEGPFALRTEVPVVELQAPVSVEDGRPCLVKGLDSPDPQARRAMYSTDAPSNLSPNQTLRLLPLSEPYGPLNLDLINMVAPGACGVAPKTVKSLGPNAAATGDDKETGMQADSFPKCGCQGVADCSSDGDVEDEDFHGEPLDKGYARIRRLLAVIDTRSTSGTDSLSSAHDGVAEAAPEEISSRLGVQSLGAMALVPTLPAGSQDNHASAAPPSTTIEWQPERADPVSVLNVAAATSPGVPGTSFIDNLADSSAGASKGLGSSPWSPGARNRRLVLLGASSPRAVTSEPSAAAQGAYTLFRAHQCKAAATVDQYNLSTDKDEGSSSCRTAQEVGQDEGDCDASGPANTAGNVETVLEASSGKAERPPDGVHGMGTHVLPLVAEPTCEGWIPAHGGIPAEQESPARYAEPRTENRFPPLQTRQDAEPMSKVQSEALQTAEPHQTIQDPRQPGSAEPEPQNEPGDGLQRTADGAKGQDEFPFGEPVRGLIRTSRSRSAKTSPLELHLWYSFAESSDTASEEQSTDALAVQEADVHQPITLLEMPSAPGALPAREQMEQGSGDGGLGTVRGSSSTGDTPVGSGPPLNSCQKALEQVQPLVMEQQVDQAQHRQLNPQQLALVNADASWSVSDSAAVSACAEGRLAPALMLAPPQLRGLAASSDYPAASADHTTSDCLCILPFSPGTWPLQLIRNIQDVAARLAHSVHLPTPPTKMNSPASATTSALQRLQAGVQVQFCQGANPDNRIVPMQQYRSLEAALQQLHASGLGDGEDGSFGNGDLYMLGPKPQLRMAGTADRNMLIRLPDQLQNAYCLHLQASGGIAGAQSDMHDRPDSYPGGSCPTRARGDPIVFSSASRVGTPTGSVRPSAVQMCTTYGVCHRFRCASTRGLDPAGESIGMTVESTEGEGDEHLELEVQVQLHSCTIPGATGLKEVGLVVSLRRQATALGVGASSEVQNTRGNHGFSPWPALVMISVWLCSGLCQVAMLTPGTGQSEAGAELLRQLLGARVLGEALGLRQSALPTEMTMEQGKENEPGGGEATEEPAAAALSEAEDRQENPLSLEVSTAISEHAAVASESAVKVNTDSMMLGSGPPSGDHELHTSHGPLVMVAAGTVGAVVTAGTAPDVPDAVAVEAMESGLAASARSPLGDLDKVLGLEPTGETAITNVEAETGQHQIALNGPECMKNVEHNCSDHGGDLAALVRHEGTVPEAVGEASTQVRPLVEGVVNPMVGTSICVASFRPATDDGHVAKQRKDTADETPTVDLGSDDTVGEALSMDDEMNAPCNINLGSGALQMEAGVIKTVAAAEAAEAVAAAVAAAGSASERALSMDTILLRSLEEFELLSDLVPLLEKLPADDLREAPARLMERLVAMSGEDSLGGIVACKPKPIRTHLAAVRAFALFTVTWYMARADMETEEESSTTQSCAACLHFDVYPVAMVQAPSPMAAVVAAAAVVPLPRPPGRNDEGTGAGTSTVFETRASVEQEQKQRFGSMYFCGALDRLLRLFLAARRKFRTAEFWDVLCRTQALLKTCGVVDKRKGFTEEMKAVITGVFTRPWPAQEMAVGIGDSDIPRLRDCWKEILDEYKQIQKEREEAAAEVNQESEPAEAGTALPVAAVTGDEANRGPIQEPPVQQPSLATRLQRRSQQVQQLRMTQRQLQASPPLLSHQPQRHLQQQTQSQQGEQSVSQQPQQQRTQQRRRPRGRPPSKPRRQQAAEVPPQAEPLQPLLPPLPPLQQQDQPATAPLPQPLPQSTIMSMLRDFALQLNGQLHTHRDAILRIYAFALQRGLSIPAGLNQTRSAAGPPGQVHMQQQQQQPAQQVMVRIKSYVATETFTNNARNYNMTYDYQGFQLSQTFSVQSAQEEGLQRLVGRKVELSVALVASAAAEALRSMGMVLPVEVERAVSEERANTLLLDFLTMLLQYRLGQEGLLSQTQAALQSQDQAAGAASKANSNAAAGLGAGAGQAAVQGLGTSAVQPQPQPGVPSLVPQAGTAGGGTAAAAAAAAAVAAGGLQSSGSASATGTRGGQATPAGTQSGPPPPSDDRNQQETGAQLLQHAFAAAAVQALAARCRMASAAATMSPYAALTGPAGPSYQPSTAGQSSVAQAASVDAGVGSTTIQHEQLPQQPQQQLPQQPQQQLPQQPQQQLPQQPQQQLPQQPQQQLPQQPQQQLPQPYGSVVGLCVPPVILPYAAPAPPQQHVQGQEQHQQLQQQYLKSMHLSNHSQQIPLLAQQLQLLQLQLQLQLQRQHLVVGQRQSLPVRPHMQQPQVQGPFLQPSDQPQRQHLRHQVTPVGIVNNTQVPLGSGEHPFSAASTAALQPKLWAKQPLHGQVPAAHGATGQPQGLAGVTAITPTYGQQTSAAVTIENPPGVRETVASASGVAAVGTREGDGASRFSTLGDIWNAI